MVSLAGVRYAFFNFAKTELLFDLFSFTVPVAPMLHTPLAISFHAILTKEKGNSSLE